MVMQSYSNSRFNHVAGFVIYSYYSSEEQDTDEEGDEVEGIVDNSESTEVSSTNQSKHTYIHINVIM